MATDVATPKNVINYKYGEFWGKLWREVHTKDGIVTLVFCGKRGRGKSRSMIQLARILDCGPDGVSRFKPEDVKFDVLEFLKGVTGKYPHGKVHVLDDAGLHMYKSDALTAMLKNVSKVLQGIRYKHPIIMLSLPHFKQLVLDARSMSDVYIEMVYVDRKKTKRAYGKIQILKVSPFTSDLYRNNLLKKQSLFNPVSEIRGEHWMPMLFEFQKPPKEFDKEYDRVKNRELDKINEQIIASVELGRDDELGVNKPKKMPFADAVEYAKKNMEKIKDRRGVINTSKIMLLKDEEGQQMFSSTRAIQIRAALR